MLGDVEIRTVAIRSRTYEIPELHFNLLCGKENQNVFSIPRSIISCTGIEMLFPVSILMQIILCLQFFYTSCILYV